MIFEKFLTPDDMRDSFRDITPEELGARGIRWVFSDIDNTLATYDDPLPPGAVSDWLRRMEEAGISVIFVSNNDRARVEGFNPARPDRGKPTYWKSAKPFTKSLRRAMREAGARREESMLRGDQLLTDAAAGKRAGLYTVIVPPIKDRTSLFWRVKRRIERPYIKKYLRLNPGPDRKSRGWEVWK